MAKKAKGNRVQVILECTEHKDSGMPGTSRYITTKNRKNTTERLELKRESQHLRAALQHLQLHPVQRQRPMYLKTLHMQATTSLQQRTSTEEPTTSSHIHFRSTV